MTSRTLVLGGARSGKSAYAERLLEDVTEVTYVATAPARPDDLEWQDRIRLHRERRPASWRTVEDPDLPALLGRPGSLLIDCASLWLTAVLDRHACWDAAPDSVGRRAAAEEQQRLVEAWATSPARTVMVSPEVGWGVVPATASGRLFRDELGRLNAALAAAADEVVLVVAGLPLRLK